MIECYALNNFLSTARIALALTIFHLIADRAHDRNERRSPCAQKIRQYYFTIRIQDRFLRITSERSKNHTFEVSERPERSTTVATRLDILSAVLDFRQFLEIHGLQRKLTNFDRP